MLPVNRGRVTSLKQMLKMESLICDGIHSDARNHMRGAFKGSPSTSKFSAALRRIIGRSPRRTN